jgi:hypothetical protein
VFKTGDLKWVILQSNSSFPFFHFFFHPRVTWLRCTGQRRGASSPCPDRPTALPLAIKWRVVPPPCPLPLTRPHRAPPSLSLPAPPLAGLSSSLSSRRSAASPPHRPPPPAPPRPCAHGARDCVADPSPNRQIEPLPEITSLWPRPELKAHRTIASVLPMPPGHHRRLHRDPAHPEREASTPYRLSIAESAPPELPSPPEFTPSSPPPFFHSKPPLMTRSCRGSSP